MKKWTRTELLKEMQRVENVINTTKSEYLKNDYRKYLKRLKREYKKGGFMFGNCKSAYR